MALRVSPRRMVVRSASHCSDHEEKTSPNKRQGSSEDDSSKQDSQRSLEESTREDVEGLVESSVSLKRKISIVGTRPSVSWGNTGFSQCISVSNTYIHIYIYSKAKTYHTAIVQASLFMLPCLPSCKGIANGFDKMPVRTGALQLHLLLEVTL